MVDKEKAIKLRKQGKTYKEIAKEMGCSEVWCKKNLSSVLKEKDVEDTKLLQECLDIAKTDQGITAYQILKIVMKPEDLSKTPTELKEIKKALLKKYKSKIKSEGGVVRPQWMVPDNASASLKKLIELVNDIDIRMYEAVCEYKDCFGLDSSYDKSIMYGLSQLSYIGHSLNPGASVEALCRNYSETAAELDKRNGKANFYLPARNQSQVTMPDFSDEDFM